MLWFLVSTLALLLALLGRELWRAARRAQLARRAADAPERLAAQAASLEQLAPGGTPARALSIATPAVVEAHALREPCLVCEGAVRLVEHSVVVADGVRLRCAETRCAACGYQRRWYFRLVTPS